MKNNPLKLIYDNGAVQIINPSTKFNGEYKELAEAIAEGRKHTYKILSDETKKK
jgi:hypothetical protein